jgi:hypothetical protein
VTIESIVVLGDLDAGDALEKGGGSEISSCLAGTGD